MSALSQHIRICRERKGMTQEELALKLRVGTQTIERYESGEQIPNMQTIFKLSTVLDVPASEFINPVYGAIPADYSQDSDSL